jgi:DNA polymerase III subunit epsilon
MTAPLAAPAAALRRTLVAIDFETADHGRDSACAVGLVRIEGGHLTGRAYHLIRPPRRRFRFTWVHGLTWDDVADAPTFAQLLPALHRFWAGADAFVAHNASFDQGVLRACCEAAGAAAPIMPFHCTVRAARSAWDLPKARLPDVCAHLGIDLDHHHAASDAEACARIALAAGLDRVRDAA